MATEEEFVLVVDDEPGIRQVVADVVREDLELPAVEAADGAEALALVAAGRPLLVLLDLMLPNVDGLEVCRRLRSDPATKSLPVIAISAARRREEAFAAGCDDFLAKPFELDDLIAIIERWLPEAKRPRRRAS